jgi:hypothetical protein
LKLLKVSKYLWDWKIDMKDVLLNDVSALTEEPDPTPGWSNWRDVKKKAEAMRNSEEFEVGDIVRYSVVGVVTASDGSFVDVDEVQTGKYLSFPLTARAGKHGSQRVELVHRPRKAKKRPAVGSYITGQQIVDTKWKAGTIIQNECGERLILSFAGYWIVQGGRRTHEFEEFAGPSEADCLFKLLVAPK